LSWGIVIAFGGSILPVCIISRLNPASRRDRLVYIGSILDGTGIDESRE
jgi:hypothetical protein